MKSKTAFLRLIPLLMVLVGAVAACKPGDAALYTALAGPHTWLDQPFDGLTLPVAPYTLKAHARDLSGVTHITFIVNDTPLGAVPTDSAADLAYAELVWNPAVPGNYTVAAAAANSAGAETRSEPARVCIGSGCPGARPLSLVTPTPTVPPPPPSSACSGVPMIASFTAAPASITAGGSATLSWNVTNADHFEITGIGAVTATGTRSVSPAATTTYTLTAFCNGKENLTEKSVTVTLADAKTCDGLPIIASFTATPTSLKVGAPSTLRWVVTNADRVELATVGQVVASGSRVVSPRATTTYRLDAFCGGKDNVTSRSVTITVVQPTPTRTATPIPPPPPPQGCNGVPNIASFSVSPTSITSGSSATLSWGAVTNADSVSIDPGIGGVGTPGSTTVSPGGTTTYTLTARCGNSTATRQVTLTVQVQQPPPAPQDKTAPAIANLNGTPNPVWHTQGCGTTTLTVTANASDPSGVSNVTLYFRFTDSKGNALSQFVSRGMNPTGGNNYSATVNVASEGAQYLGGQVYGRVNFYVTARDNPGNTATSGTANATTQQCIQ